MDESLKIVSDPAAEKEIRDLYKRYAGKVTELLGISEIPEIEIRIVEDAPYRAWVEDGIVFVDKDYLAKRENDGALIHEFVHLTRHSKVHIHWVSEGTADYVRYKLGFQSSRSRQRFVKGKALAGYQTSAHFLMHLEEIQPEIVKELSRALMEGRYSEKIFKKMFGKSLAELVEEYERKYEEA